MVEPAASPTLPDLHAAAHRLHTVIQGVSFWTAVVLPFVYLPVLVLGGATSSPMTLVSTAIGLNVVALLLGHRHEPVHLD